MPPLHASAVPCLTTIEAATAAVKAIEALRSEEMQVQSLQERFSKSRSTSDVATGRYI